jgi:hypothetical protein
MVSNPDELRRIDGAKCCLSNVVRMLVSVGKNRSRESDGRQSHNNPSSALTTSPKLQVKAQRVMLTMTGCTRLENPSRASLRLGPATSTPINNAATGVSV